MGRPAKKGRPPKTKKTIYDLTGREVVRLVDQHLDPGFHQVIWNGRDARGRSLPTGIYLARLFAQPKAGLTPEYTKSVKMLLLK